MSPLDPRLFRVLPESRRAVAALGLVGIAQGVLTIATAFALAHLVTVVAGPTPSAGVGRAVTVLGGLLLGRALLASLTERTASTAGIRVSGALRRRLVVGILGRGPEAGPGSHYDPPVASTLVAQGCSSIETYVVRFLPALLQAAVVPVLAVVTLAVVDWPSALIVVLTLPLLPLFAALIGRATEDATRRRWRALEGLAGHFLDVVRGLPTLVTYDRAAAEVDGIRKVSERHRSETMRTLRIAFLSSTALELLATISVALVAVACGLRLASGGLDLTTALVAILLAPEAYWPIRRVGAEYHAAADGTAALGTVLDEIVRSPASVSPPPAHDLTMTLTGVTVHHAGRPTPTLVGVDLACRRGLTAVTGPSGGGKTTLLEAMAGVRQVSGGTRAASRTHLVTQRPLLLAATVADNLALGTAAAAPTPEHSSMWAALRQVGLDGDVAAMPAGLDTLVGDDGFGVSAGQRARLALARALLSGAPVVLVDEPTAHLDAGSRAQVIAALRELAHSRIVVVVTHDTALAALAAQHVEVWDGRVRVVNDQLPEAPSDAVEPVSVA